MNTELLLEKPTYNPGIGICQSRPDSAALPLHSGKNSLGGSQGGLQALSFLGLLPMMTQSLVLFVKITSSVFSIV